MSNEMEKFFFPLPNSEGRKASFRMSEADKRKFLASLSYPPSADSVDNALMYNEFTDDSQSQFTESSVGQSTVINMKTNSVVNVQPQLMAALAVAENILPNSSPNLRKISVKQEEAESDTNKSAKWFGKKKPPETGQKLVFSFSKESDPAFEDEVDVTSTGGPNTVTTAAAAPPMKKVSSQTSNDLKTRTLSENSTASVPGMIITEAVATSANMPPAEQAGSSVIEFGGNLLKVKAKDRQDATSMRSYRSVTNTIISSGRDLEEETMVKRQRFWDFLTMVLSLSYALTVVILGITVYSFDILIKEKEEVQTTVTSSYNIFLCVVGIAWLCYLVVDINFYVQAIEGHSRGSLDLGEIKLIEGEDGELHIEMSLPGEKRTLPEYYGFASGRHSGSFYLKIGAGVFCIGHVIHMGLNLVKEIVYSTSDDEYTHNLCSNYANAAVDLLTPIFSIIQCFVIFKYGNVIVNKNKWLARFAFMHCIASSVCLWMNTIINETLDTLVVKKYYYHTCDNSSDHGYAAILGWRRDGDDDDTSSVIRLECLDKELTLSEHFDCVLELKYFCAASNKLSSDIFNIASVLYPFSIEFSFLVVGVWYILWSNIAKIDAYKESLHFLPSVTPRGSVDEGQRMEGHKQALILFADCSSSNKGLFMGIILLIVTIIGGIVVLILEDPCDKSSSSTAVVISNVLESGVLIICILASIMSYVKIMGLDVNPHPVSFLDDMLLMLCLPSFIAFFLICVGPTVLYEFEPYYTVTNSLTVIQVLIQTPMIVDGLRRCSNSYKNKKKLAGRNTLMFLVVANLALYLLETIVIKSKANQKIKIEFYGATAWTVLSHITLPLCVFYRFHSSAALVDIWNSAYKPPGH